jgi:hypothetical protein
VGPRADLDAVVKRKIPSLCRYSNTRSSSLQPSAIQNRESLHQHLQTGSGAHPISYPIGTGVLSLGIKRPCRADHSSPSSAEIKNAWSYTSTSPYVFVVLS